MNQRINILLAAMLMVLATGLGGARSAAAADVTVELANVPLVAGVSKTIPPNIYFIMDDSGSMADDFMPDSVSSNRSKRCFRNFGYNKIYYNPAITYAPPVKADGSDFDASDYNAAKTDGFSATSTTVDLATTVFNLGNNPFTTTNGSKNVVVAHNAHGYPVGTKVTFSSTVTFRGVTITAGTNYTITAASTNNYTIQVAANASSGGTGGGSGIVETANVPGYFWYEYTANPTSPVATCAADASYTKRVPTTSEEKENFANWYSYYRTRVLMMKSSTGHAFKSIDDKYRVGYSAISEKATGASKFLNVGKFTCCGSTTQKYKFYQKLYAAGASGYTPLRGALSKAGRLYSGTLKGADGTANPVQFSCQQNFAILTTDGYWNLQNEASGSSTANNTTNYGPYRADNVTLIGDWDAETLPSPTNTDPAEKTTETPWVDKGPYSNTLADIAAYYYRNDLYPTSVQGGYLDDGVTRYDLEANNLSGAGAESAVNWQHMTTFTMGLGVSGKLVYDPNYFLCLSTSTNCGDYPYILDGTKKWPDPKVTDTATELPERLDDLWHAAVNGRGRYLSASDPESVIKALSKALAAIAVKAGAASAAATSSLQPVKDNQDAYVAQYKTGAWIGDVQSRLIDLSTGELQDTVPPGSGLPERWSAQAELQSKVQADGDDRKIYTFDKAATDKLRKFDKDNLKDEIDDKYFDSSSANPNGALTQYALWDSDQQDTAADNGNEAMINFIRGQFGHEDQDGVADENKLFRDREAVLGDIANTSPVFVRTPEFQYTDTGYAEFVSKHKRDPANPVTTPGRDPMLYVSANDGMLHAFDAVTGEERWAYIPSMVIPYLYKLADAAYAGNHRPFVDGQITVGDVSDGKSTDPTWRTILVGGLGGGGAGYYALDVTDPASPKALWEFTQNSDGDIGYSYGNALITKRSKDGRWVVVFASGYNNCPKSKTYPACIGGDGKGRLYVVDALTGQMLEEIISDSAVTTANLSGIAKINGYVNNTLVDNTTQYVYAGDLGGALWRFDLTSNTSQRLGKTSATAGDQPITVRPDLGRVRDASGSYHRVVYFGTGRYLGFGDVSETSPSNTTQQAIYAVMDTGSDLGVFTQSSANLVEQTLVVNKGDDTRSIPDPVAVDWSTNKGWFVTLPLGERINVDPRLQLGTFVLVSNLPGTDYCDVGGKTYTYALGYRSGASVSGDTSAKVGALLARSISTGLTLIKLGDKLVAEVTLADTSVVQFAPGVEAAEGVGVRRVSWREIN